MEDGKLHIMIWLCILVQTYAYIFLLPLPSSIPLLLLAAIHFFIFVIYFCSMVIKTDHLLM